MAEHINTAMLAIFEYSNYDSILRTFKKVSIFDRELRRNIV